MAGCIGGEDTPSETNASGQDVEPTSANETSTPNATDTEPRTTWTNQTREGVVTGIFVPVTGTAINVPLASENTLIEFTAEDGTEDLYLNLTSEGGEISMGIDSPDCDAGPERAGCQFVTTSDGEASYHEPNPTAGTWELTFFSGEPVSVEVGWELEIAQAVPAGS